MFILIFNQLLKMLFIMILAIICFKIGMITQEGNRNISNLLLMVVNPCLIITVYQTDYRPELVKGLLLSIIAAFLAHFIGIIIANLCVRKGKNPDYVIERACVVYSNCGFIGIPLVNSVLGAEGVFYLSAYMTVFNLLVWTHGLGLLRGKYELKSIKEGLRSPMIIATIIALILFFTQIKIPGALLDSMTYIADSNTPLAMMVAGFSVAQSDIRKMFSNIRLYFVSFLKLLVVPLAVLLFLWILRLDYNVLYSILIAAACPASTTITMMCIRYNLNYTYTSEIFSFSTVLSIATIPVVALIADLIL